MLSFIHTILKYMFPYESSATENKDDINNIVEYIQNSYDKFECEENKSDIDENCDYKIGIITFITADYILIDSQYVYYMTPATINDFTIGDKILYVCNKNFKIKKIISKVEENWDDTVIEAKIKNPNINVFTKYIIGKVKNRINRTLFMDINDLSIDLNMVQSKFVPMIGDWLKIESLVELDENAYNLCGQIIKIYRIYPLRSKLEMGMITTYDHIKQFGTINKNIEFIKAVCDSGYNPCIGDKIITDCIESDQGLFQWRSLNVLPIIQQQIQSSITSMNCVTDKNIAELIQNKYGIIINEDLNITLKMNEERNVEVTLQNTSDSVHTLHKSYFMLTKTESQLILIQPASLDASKELKPCNTISYIFKCTAKFPGATEELCIFNFGDFEIGRIFKITVTCKNESIKTHVNSSVKKNKRMLNLEMSNTATYIPGIRPFNTARFVKVRNVIFKIPQYYWNLILQSINEQKTETEIEKDLQYIAPSLTDVLSFKSYTNRFHALLYLEEIAQIINLEQYNMESAIMKHYKDYLVLDVPGLAEKRPSLLIGDKAIISFKWNNSEDNLKYEGYIHKVTGSHIFLKFNTKFHQEYNNEDCQVTFKSSYTAIQRCHNAINIAVHRLGAHFLFPTCIIEKNPQLKLQDTEMRSHTNCLEIKQHQDTSNLLESSFVTKICGKSSNIKSSERMSIVKSIRDTEKTNDQSTIENNFDCDTIISHIKKRKIYWFNEQLNSYQKTAVKNILKGLARPLPYIIFGPPGTGKTITLCESILQIFSLIPESKLLIATPSNSSANLILERLIESNTLKPGDVVRLLANHCLGSDLIPDNLLPYCATIDLASERLNGKNDVNSTGVKINCNVSELRHHRIIIGTCIALGILHNIGFSNGHFSHIFVDEAGQATEPEIMIPLNFLAIESGQAILAGDPLQLGPVVQSKLAKRFGLDESFLSRLLRHFPYQKDAIGFDSHYDPRVITKLVMNYRSLPDIMKLYSSLFYDSKLEAQVSAERSEEAQVLQSIVKILPIILKKGGTISAVLFHGINGTNCKDADSPSWYNPEEATQVYLYLLKLYKCGLSENDIGIITPYQKQVLQIRNLLLELDVPLPNVSSVEGFQGQERKVILISTVRSSDNFINEDIKYSLGFIACPRRLNVAISRARALLIIIGNPKLLSHDPYWRSVLEYCIKNGNYTGCTFYSSHIQDNKSD